MFDIGDKGINLYPAIVSLFLEESREVGGFYSVISLVVGNEAIVKNVPVCVFIVVSSAFLAFLCFPASARFIDSTF